MIESTIRIDFVSETDISKIIPYLQLLNPRVDPNILEERSREMFTQNYACLGVFDKNILIGICGLWFMTRHYPGRCIEPDHVIIDKEYRSKGVGEILFDWIHTYALKNSYESAELNTYVNNTASHKFYYNHGYQIKGYHFVKDLL